LWNWWEQKRINGRGKRWQEGRENYETRKGGGLMHKREREEIQPILIVLVRRRDPNLPQQKAEKHIDKCF